ncbi:alpha/beta hydrolase [Isosphaeraceae bacterium EP7]
MILPGHSAARRVWRFLRLPVFVLMGMLIVLTAIQDRLIFPGADSQGRPEARVTPPPGATIVTLDANGDKVVALFGPALGPGGSPDPEASRRPTILFFYGNGMCLADSISRFESFRRLGANVLIPDYLGFGLSGGSAGESGCYRTADAAFDHLSSRKDVDPARIVAAGWSLGAAVAVDLAARRPVAGLAIFSPFTSLAEMVRRSFPFLPTSLLLQHKFDNLSKIGGVKVPVLIGHGRRDQLIPFAMSERLAERVPGATRIDVDAADHNDYFDAGGRSVEDALHAFLDRIASAR